MIRVRTRVIAASDNIINLNRVLPPAERVVERLGTLLQPSSAGAP